MHSQDMTHHPSLPGGRFLAAISLWIVLVTSSTGEDAPALDNSSWNRTVRPQDDFFEFANGTWIANTEIPADKTRWGAFIILREQSRDAVQAIIDEVSKSQDVASGSDTQKIRDLYRSFMDVRRVESLGYSPIKTLLDRIDSMTSKTALAAYWADASRWGLSHPLGAYVTQDAGDATRYAVYLSQSGLGLPDRDYYVQDDERSRGLQVAYREMLTTLFTLADFDRAEARTTSVYALETQLATAQWTRVENRDRVKTYNLRTLEQIQTALSHLDVASYLQTSGFPLEAPFVIRQPSYLEGLNLALEAVSLEDWKDYLRARTLVDYAAYLSEPFFDAHFNFYSKTLSGQEEPEPRARRGVNLVNGLLGELMGKIYVKRHFPPEAKTRMLEMVDHLKVAMKESLEKVSWMTEPTRAEALTKLSKFHTKIGYPDEWKDYNSLSMDPNDLLGNLQRAAAFEHQRQVDKLGQPVDRNEWFMTPQTVNAYYNPSLNEIVFPAAILQPPFFNMKADDAVNYGAIGMVIGHEIGHGFDDQGRRFDGDGNLRDWWQESDAQAYASRTERLVAQYAQYEPVPQFFINGQLTLGENIGDLGGMTLAYRAFHKSLKGQWAPIIDGLTSDQRFFFSLAQIWRSKEREASTIRRLKTDTHAPPKFRVNGPLRNFDPFYKALNVKESDAMWLPSEERVSIW